MSLGVIRWKRCEENQVWGGGGGGAAGERAAKISSSV